MRTTPHPLLLIVLLVGVAAAAWFLLHEPAPTPTASGEGTLNRPQAPSAEPHLVVQPPDRDPPQTDAPPSTATTTQVPGVVEPEEQPRFLHPEQLRLETVRYEDVPASDVLLDISRQARLEMRLPVNVAKILANKRVTIDRTDTTGALVIFSVLQPHGLNYTVREGELRIFVDDD